MSCSETALFDIYPTGISSQLIILLSAFAAGASVTSALVCASPAAAVETCPAAEVSAFSDAAVVICVGKAPPALLLGDVPPEAPGRLVTANNPADSTTVMAAAIPAYFRTGTGGLCAEYFSCASSMISASIFVIPLYSFSVFLLIEYHTFLFVKTFYNIRQDFSDNIIFFSKKYPLCGKQRGTKVVFT